MVNAEFGNPYELFEIHRNLIANVLDGLRDYRRLGSSLVDQLKNKFNGPIETDSIHPQKLGGHYSENHIGMKLSAITGGPDHEKTLWQTETYTRNVPDKKVVVFIMNDTEYRVGDNEGDGRKFQVEMYTDGTRARFQIAGPIELITPTKDTDRPSWRLPEGALSEQQNRMIDKARKEAANEKFISMKISFSIADVNDKEPEDPLRPDVEIVYVRFKNDFKKLYKFKRWQSVRLHSDGTETIEADRPADEVPRMFVPKFDKAEDHVVEQNTLDPVEQ